MHAGRTVFAQLMDFLPLREFRACVARYGGDYKVQSFSCLDQFLTLAFAQLTYRESLREIVICLNAVAPKLYHMGIRGPIRRSTVADANERRDWHIYHDFAHGLIARARPLYAADPLGLDLDDTVYALDSTLIHLCLALFPWAAYRRTTSAVKLHTLLDLRGSIPTVVHLTEGKAHDLRIWEHLTPEPGAFYVMDRGYMDFARLFAVDQAGAFFVLRARTPLRAARVRSHPLTADDQAAGIQSDHTVRLTVPASQARYPTVLRRVRVRDADQQRTFLFLSNAFTLPAATIGALYRLRWHVELFFRWIKQHLRIKAFYGTSENAVQTQLWIAIAVYVLVAIVKKRLQSPLSLFEILQVLSLSLFEKTPLAQLLTNPPPELLASDFANQLLLFD